MPRTQSTRPNDRIDTGGGAYVAGNVDVGTDGEFVGRDKIWVPRK